MNQLGLEDIESEMRLRRWGNEMHTCFTNGGC